MRPVNARQMPTILLASGRAIPRGFDLAPREGAAVRRQGVAMLREGAAVLH